LRGHHGREGAVAVATHPAAAIVVSALVGALGLGPTLAAIAAGKDIAFANKEVLVIAGELITAAVRERRVRLLPVDSEHNAVHQCMRGGRLEVALTKPVLFGDRLTSHLRIDRVEDGRAILTLRVENQRGESVLAGIAAIRTVAS